MTDSYLCIPKAKMLLLGLSDSPGDQVSSYKGIPPSASPNEKNSVMVGLALPIRHRSEDP